MPGVGGDACRGVVIAGAEPGGRYGMALHLGSGTVVFEAKAGCGTCGTRGEWEMRGIVWGSSVVGTEAGKSG
ncbi:hypothetical protein M0657_010067 [Pyricularia oryzae]|nr:hypothetical protein M0657_010067 [Pyricularia oryzae]KAI7913362.1 hypothetical protein M9X92_009506 [Pyricularia oryzae]